MKRLWLAVMLVLTLGIGTLTVMAQEPEANPKHITDEAKLLTDTELDELEAKAEKIAGQYGMDVAVVTRKTIYGADAQRAADDIFDTEGYGSGEGKDGILLLVSMDDRDWSLTTHGAAIDVFTDYRLDDISSHMLAYLSKAAYYDAFDTYLHDVEYYLEDNASRKDAGTQEGTSPPGAPAAKDGSADGTDTDQPGTEGKDAEAAGAAASDTEAAAEQENMEPEKEVNPWLNMTKLSVGVGAVITGIYIAFQMCGMKNVRRQEQADKYMNQDSYELTKKQDIFLYTRTIEKEIKKDPPRREEPERDTPYGRSTTHVSRSGERHGGKKGKF